MAPPSSRCTRDPPADVPVDASRERRARRRLHGHAVLLALATVVLAGVIGLVLQRSWHDSVDRQTENVRIAAETIAASIERTLLPPASALLDIAAAVQQDMTLLTDGRSILTRQLVRARLRHDGVAGFAATDATGLVIAGSGVGDDPSEVSLAEDPSFLHHLTTADSTFHLGQPAVSRNDGFESFVLSRAIRAPDGVLLGVAFATVSTAEFRNALAPVLARAPGSLAVVDPASQPILGLSTGATSLDLAPAETGRSPAIQRGSDTRRDEPGGDRAAQVTASAGSNLLPFTVLVTSTTDAMRRNWIRGHAIEIGVLGLLLVAGVAANALLYRALRRQVRAEEALRLSFQARFREGVEMIRDGVAIWDGDGRLVAWNRRYAEIARAFAGILRPGIRFDVLVEVAASTVFAPDATGRRDAWLERRRRAFAAADGTVSEAVLRDGRIIETAYRRAANGDIVNTIRDVTEDRLAQRRIAESEARFRDGIESMAEGFVLWDASRRLSAWNERLREIMPHLAPFLRKGVSQAEFARQACAAAFPDWTEEARQSWVRERLDAAWEPTYRATLPLAGDRHVTVTQRRTSDGGLVVTYHDITTEFRASRRLEATARKLAASESESRRLALVATNVQSGITILDAESRITWMNPAMVEMTGFTVDRALGRTPQSLFVGGNSSAESLARIRESLDAGQRVRAELEIRRVNGRRLWVELDATPIFDAEGRIESIVGLHTDITERKRHQEELERALVAAREVNEQQRRFVAIASHEFRTPLAVIDSAAQRILARLQDALPDEGVTRRLDRIRGAIGRMTGMIDLMLSSERLEEGRLTLEPEAVDLGALLREVVERQHQVTPEFTIATDDLPSDLTIEADRRLLDQVFTNLVSNAAKYSGASRRIEIAARRTGGGVEIAVRDYGLGIAAADLPRLFTRFFRAGTAEGIPGTGIGLHLTRELVAMHGGTIEVASEIGVGTTFVVRLPAVRPLEAGDRDAAD